MLPKNIIKVKQKAEESFLHFSELFTDGVFSSIEYIILSHIGVVLRIKNIATDKGKQNGQFFVKKLMKASSVI